MFEIHYAFRLFISLAEECTEHETRSPKQNLLLIFLTHKYYAFKWWNVLNKIYQKLLHKF